MRVAKKEKRQSFLTTSIGSTVRKLRLEKGLTLRDMEKSSYISMAHMSDIERGNKEASNRFFEVIAGGLGMTTTELLKAVYEEMERGTKWQSN